MAATDRKLGLQATARLFALLNMAMSDAYVAGWDSKFHYDFWRPDHGHPPGGDRRQPGHRRRPGLGVRAGDPAGAGPPLDPQRAGRRGGRGAGPRVRGRHAVHLHLDHRRCRRRATRSFPSFTAAANENADSRVMAGLHFRFACKAGQALGRQVGAWVTTTALRPMKNLAAKR